MKKIFFIVIGTLFAAITSGQENPNIITAIKAKYDGQGRFGFVLPEYSSKYGIYYFTLIDRNDCQFTGIWDSNGHEILQPVYGSVDINQFQIFAKLYNGQKGYTQIYGPKPAGSREIALEGVVDDEGRITVPIIYSRIQLISGTSLAIVEKGGSYYFNDDYDFCINRLGKWGIIDVSNNKEIVKCKYDYISSQESPWFSYASIGWYNSDYARNLRFRFNSKGKRIDYSDDPKDGKWGYLDIKGKEIIPAQYESATDFKDGYAQVYKNGVTSFIDIYGKPYGINNDGELNKTDTNIPVTTKVNENTFAFIIANENYAHFTGADYSINDGKVFAEYCKKTLGIPEKNVRYYEDATYGNITNAVKKLQDIADVYEGDAKIIFYYSGLGATADKNMEKYLLATDASMSALENTGYSVNALLTTINNLNVGYSWVVLDAPFSNLDKSGKPLASGRGVAMKSKPAHAEGKTIVTLSSSGEQTAFSSKKYGHSLFTYGLLEKLQQAKGDCSIKELNDYAASWVKKSAMTEFDKAQIPDIKISYELKLNFNNIKF